MLTASEIDRILAELPRKTVGLIGDLFLDRYLDIEHALTEPSIETGLDAYQIVNVRSYPGAMGTVVNNLAALGVGKIVPISFIGDDGEGYELLQALKALRVVDWDTIKVRSDRRTPTYCKPMILEAGKPTRELNRLDTKNRKPTPNELEAELISLLKLLLNRFDALLVLDQVSEINCGVLTETVRNAVIDLAEKNPRKFILADSREQIHLFKRMWIKPNSKEIEILIAQRTIAEKAAQLSDVGEILATDYAGAFCTKGDQGIDIVSKSAHSTTNPIYRANAPSYPVSGLIDIVGAGDSCSAAIASAMACGCDVLTAAQFGNLIASITIQQIGVTGTASPKQVRERWDKVVKNDCTKEN